jgi:ER-bound oxygenase mpaB/B'/Rubber oxygenase, catalytic domain
MRGSPYLEEIRRLDPVRDHQRIVYLDACFEFPWDTTRSLELALFRTFAVPSIATLLDSTGEFVRRAQKRYDDTDLLISSFAEAGYDSEMGRRAIRRMNRLHGRFDIENEDFLYVLSTMALEPIRWNARFGRRPLIEAEKQATFQFWREVGRRMAIRDVPETLDDLERFNVAFERERFAYSEAGRRVADSTMAMFVAWFPGVPYRLGRRAISAILDDPLLDALGYRRPPAALRRSAATALRARGRASALLGPRRRPRVRTALRRRSYPGGYAIEELGPPPASPARQAP